MYSFKKINVSISTYGFAEETWFAFLFIDKIDFAEEQYFVPASIRKTNFLNWIDNWDVRMTICPSPDWLNNNFMAVLVRSDGCVEHEISSDTPKGNSLRLTKISLTCNHWYWFGNDWKLPHLSSDFDEWYLIGKVSHCGIYHIWQTGFNSPFL